MEDRKHVALVTGGARGIGREVVLRLLADGFLVCFTYRTSTGALDEIRADAASRGLAPESIRAFMGDAADPKTGEVIVSSILGELDRLDILVNNAGVRRDALVYNMSSEDWSAVMQTNLDGAFHMSKAVVAPMMKQRSGAIVNIASLSGLHAVVGQANYAASKAGLIALTKTLAREVGRSGIRVNCVAPGLVATDMTENLDAEARKALLREVPMRRMVRVEEVAAAVSFLASDNASGITGQVLCVDCGTTA